MELNITKVESFIVDLPTCRPHKLSMTTMRNQTMVLCLIHCSDGVVGIGEGTTIGGLSYCEESPEIINSVISDYFAPALVGKDPLNINQRMKDLNLLAKGNRISKSAIEMALLDAQGKRRNLTVGQLLGGTLVDRVPVLWTLASGNTLQDIEEAQHMLELRRHNVFKIKVGANDARKDVRHVCDIKKALGDTAKITVDVNQAWSESTCKYGLRAFQECGVDLIEQPLAKGNFEGMARVTQKYDMPIMADESVSTPEDALRMAKLGAGDVAALKIGKSGGPIECIKTAAVLEAAGIALYGGTLLEGTIGSVASAFTFATLRNLEWGTELFGPLLLTDDIVVNPPVFKDFHMELPTGPGLGLDLDMNKVKHYKRK